MLKWINQSIMVILFLYRWKKGSKRLLQGTKSKWILSETFFCTLSLYLLVLFALETEPCWAVFLMNDSLTVWGGFSSSLVSAVFWIPIDEAPCSVSFTNLNKKHYEKTLLKEPVVMRLINQTGPELPRSSPTHSLFMQTSIHSWEGGFVSLADRQPLFSKDKKFMPCSCLRPPPPPSPSHH